MLRAVTILFQCFLFNLRSKGGLKESDGVDKVKGVIKEGQGEPRKGHGKSK